MNILCMTATSLGFRNFCQVNISMEIEQAFAEHASIHGLSYGTKDEYNFRLELFSQADAAIEKINAEEESFTVGHNFMSTWTRDEYKKILGD